MTTKSSDGAAGSSTKTSSIFYASSSIIRKLMVPMLEQECRSTLPAPTQLQELSRIYFEKVHPIFPVIDQDAYKNLDSEGSEIILLQQGICLAASKNFAASPFLLLPESETPLSCREFGERISGVIRLSMEIGMVTNRLVTIQVSYF